MPKYDQTLSIKTLFDQTPNGHKRNDDVQIRGSHIFQIQFNWLENQSVQCFACFAKIFYSGRSKSNVYSHPGIWLGCCKLDLDKLITICYFHHFIALLYSKSSYPVGKSSLFGRSVNRELTPCHSEWCICFTIPSSNKFFLQTCRRLV